MNKLHILYGFIVGVLCSLLGIFLFIELFTPYHLNKGVHFFSGIGYMGKIVTLGTILNIAAFFIFLKLGKDDMAKGVIAATVALMMMTVFI